jgi:hypothetical protein
MEPGRDLAQWQIHLGGNRTASPAWNVIVPSTSRTPMLTATKATLSVASSSRTSADRNAVRSTPMVARR